MNQKRKYFFLIPPAALGFFTSISQILLMREFFVVAGGNELLIGIFLFVWLAGLACGSLCASWFSDRISKPLQLAVIFLFAQSLLMPSNIIVIRCLRQIFAIPPGELIPPGTFFGGALLTIFPFSFLTGLNFSLLSRALTQPMESGSLSIGRIYSYEALGCIVGGLLFTFVLVNTLPSIPIACLAVIILISALQFFKFANEPLSYWYYRLAIISSVLFLVAGLSPVGATLDRIVSQWRLNSIAPGYRIIDETETPYQHLSLVSAGDQGATMSLLANGSFVASFPEPYGAAEDVHFIVTMCPQIPQRILILGGGNPQILVELLKYPLVHVDYVEADQKALPFLEKHLSNENKSALQDERVRIHSSDARTFVRHQPSSSEPYDLIWSNLPEPSSAEINRFYTVDFNEECLEMLGAHGVFVTSCSSAVNYFGKAVSPYVQSLFKSLQAVYQDVLATPGTRMIFLASSEKGVLTFDAATLARRYESRRIASEWFSPNNFYSLLEPNHIETTRAALLNNLDDVPLNTDLRPISYLFNLRLWARKMGSRGDGLFSLINALKFRHILFTFLLLFCGCLFYVFIRRSQKERRKGFTILCLIGSTGACGMAAEVLLLYLFQSIYGSVYQKIGLFFACFMAGLTCGSLLTVRLKNLRLFQSESMVRPLLWAEGAYWAFFMASGLILPRWLPPESFFYLITLLAGFITGFEFPLAAGMYQEGGHGVGRVAGRINMADSLGAALGALATGVVLMPALGIHLTLIFLTFVKLSSFTLLRLSLSMK